MRCPACGATNPDTAQWCGQCLTRFNEPEPEPAPAPAPAPAAQPSAAKPPPQASSTASEGFRRQGDDLEWACPSCGEFNSIDELHCAVCGTAFTDRFKTPEQPEPPRNWTAALGISVIAPGAGHLAVGRYGSGAARLILFVVWMAGALMVGSGSARATSLAVAPLALGAVAVWAGSVLDIHRLSQGQEEVLAGRRLLVLVVVVLVLLAAGLLGSALRLLT